MADDNWLLAIVSEWTVLWAVTGLLPHSEALAATQPHAPILPTHMLPGLISGSQKSGFLRDISQFLNVDKAFTFFFF